MRLQEDGKEENRRMEEGNYERGGKGGKDGKYMIYIEGSKDLQSNSQHIVRIAQLLFDDVTRL